MVEPGADQIPKGEQLAHPVGGAPGCSSDSSDRGMMEPSTSDPSGPTGQANLAQSSCVANGTARNRMDGSHFGQFDAELALLHLFEDTGPVLSGLFARIFLSHYPAKRVDTGISGSA